MSYQFNNDRLFHNCYKLRVPLLLIMSVLFFSQSAHGSPHIIDIRSSNKAPQCRVYSKPALHEALDKICYVCHEMFSHIRPNLRSECRSKCFRNEHFRGCVSVFAPGLSVGLFSKGYGNGDHRA